MGTYIFLFYMASIADRFEAIAAVAFVCLFITGIFGWMFVAEKAITKKTLGMVIAGLLVVELICLAVPGKDFWYIAAGGIAAKEAAESKIGQKTLEFIEAKMDEALSEMKGKSK